jgi:hypothetical protein
MIFDHKTLAIILFLFCTLTACGQNNRAITTVTPKHFKVELPYQVDNTGIILDSYWGADKIRHKLYFDNNAPVWANSNLIRDNKSLRRSKKLLYKTSLADGTRIRGDVYTCDSISLGQVTFRNVDVSSSLLISIR